MQNIPTWFWIVLVLIAVIAIGAFIWSKKQKPSPLQNNEDLGPLNAVDDVNSLQYAI